MKRSTMLVGGGMFIFAWWAIQTQGDQTRLQEIHRDVGMGAQCEKTKNLEGRTWMACRYSPDRDQGSVWLLHEDEEGEIWIARNGPAMKVVNRFEELPEKEQQRSIRIRLRTPEDIADPELARLPGVPWERLN